MLIKADQSCLMMIDVQAPARVIRNTRILMTAASRLGIPMLLAEQYPKGLGISYPSSRTWPRTARSWRSCISRA